MPDEVASICEKCGASVYRQHIDSGIARYEGGNLLCAHCCSEYERSHDALAGAGSDGLGTISLDGNDESSASSAMSSSKILSSSAATLGGGHGWDESDLKRAADPSAVCATRCRTFHSKLNQGAIEFMNTHVNEWVDQNDDVVIKFATSTIGVFEGKHSDPNLILTVFY